MADVFTVLCIVFNLSVSVCGVLFMGVFAGSVKRDLKQSEDEVNMRTSLLWRLEETERLEVNDVFDAVYGVCIVSRGRLMGCLRARSGQCEAGFRV